MQDPASEIGHVQEQYATAPFSEVNPPVEEKSFVEISENLEEESQIEESPSSRLIEFPGVTRRAVPEWRRELSARVREVHERRAREAAAEAEEAARLQLQLPQSPVPQLELLPKTDSPDINPVLAAALRRIERAYQPTVSTYSRAATAVAVAEENQLEVEFASEPPAVSEMEAIMPSESAPIPERTHNLVVVQAPVATEPVAIEKPKPKRLIVEDDPALSYLDSIAPMNDSAGSEEKAPVFRRMFAAVCDVIVVAFLTLPIVAIIELQNGDWHQPKMIALLSGIAIALMFIYATVSTALTGRTFGMRVLSLRAIDIRTRLIPTGKQSAGRALFYLVSFATLGLGLLMVFARGEGKTLHDRLTSTAVIQD